MTIKTTTKAKFLTPSEYVAKVCEHVECDYCGGMHPLFTGGLKGSYTCDFHRSMPGWGTCHHTINDVGEHIFCSSAACRTASRAAATVAWRMDLICAYVLERHVIAQQLGWGIGISAGVLQLSRTGNLELQLYCDRHRRPITNTANDVNHLFPGAKIEQVRDNTVIYVHEVPVDIEQPLAGTRMVHVSVTHLVDG